jgi:hypothetical protein
MGRIQRMSKLETANKQPGNQETKCEFLIEETLGI